MVLVPGVLEGFWRAFGHVFLTFGPFSGPKQCHKLIPGSAQGYLTILNTIIGLWDAAAVYLAIKPLEITKNTRA